MADPTRIEARIAQMVFPEQANHYGTLFGGEAMKMLDMAAFVAASRYCHQEVVTASIDRVDFDHPIRVGHLVEAVATVTRTGKTSIIVDVELFSEDMLTGERVRATRGEVTMVALDENRRPTPVIPLA